jgi:hypothetical protein
VKQLITAGKTLVALMVRMNISGIWLSISSMVLTNAAILQKAVLLSLPAQQRALQAQRKHLARNNLF